MTPRQADQLIKSGERVTLKSTFYKSEPAAEGILITGRNRFDIFIAYEWKGETRTGVMDRGDIEVIA